MKATIVQVHHLLDQVVAGDQDLTVKALAAFQIHHIPQDLDKTMMKRRKKTQN